MCGVNIDFVYAYLFWWFWSNSHFQPSKTATFNCNHFSSLCVFVFKKKRLSCVYSGGKKGLQFVIPRQMLLEELNG